MDIELPEISQDGLNSMYARTAWLLRESRKEILRRHAVDDEAALLVKIRQGAVAEHPAYEHYLSALILDQMRAQLRAEMMALDGGSVAALPTISVHMLLKQELERHYAGRMTEAPRLAQDALVLAFDTGLLMEVRYHNSDEYSISWSYGEHQLALDTAPLHGTHASFPRHLHAADDTIRPDDATRTGAGCWENFSALLEILLTNPLLEMATPGSAR
ncbi:MAG TPA: hypothetical protein VL051_14395 [Burkholderiaceae bacterium]|nr:hypothetical protein [Burkholderiaceae bacterium]